MSYASATDDDIISTQGKIEAIDPEGFWSKVRAMGSEAPGFSRRLSGEERRLDADLRTSIFRDAVHEASHAMFILTSEHASLLTNWERERIHVVLKKIFPLRWHLPLILDEEVLARRVEAFFLHTLGLAYEPSHFALITCMEFYKSFGFHPNYDSVYKGIESRPSYDVLARAEAIVDWYNSTKESK